MDPGDAAASPGSDRGGRAPTSHPLTAPTRDEDVRRARALDALARRWEVPVTCVVAAGGFGKTTALRQAVAENLQAERGIDRTVACRAFDVAADALASRLLDALEVPTTVSGEDPVALAGVVVGAIAGFSPVPVCLVLDDVHELGDTTPATELVNRVVRSLPGNGHIVLSGRRLPSGIGLARLRAADGLVSVGEDELCFDDDEVRLLAEHHGLDEGAVLDMGRWPALVRLSITAGRSASMEFLRQELLDELGPDVRQALGVAVLAGSADDALLAELGCAVGVAALAVEVPLVEVDDHGRAVPHALWRDVLDQLLEAPVVDEAIGAIGAHLAGTGAHEEALALLADAGQWDGASEVVLDALRGGDALVGRAQAVRWLRRFPASERERPEVLVLRGLVARLTAFDFHDPQQRDAEFFGAEALSVDQADPDGTELFRRAAATFADAGRPDGEAVAVIAQLWQAWDHTDRDELARLHAQVVALDQSSPGVAGAFPRIMEALVMALEGDLGTALDALEEVRASDLHPSTRAFVELQRSGIAIFAGDGALALEASRAAAEATVAQVDSEVAGHGLVMAWLTGDPEPALRAIEVAAPIPVRSPQNRFRGIVYAHALWASIGPCDPVELATLRTQGTGSARDNLFAVMAAVASHCSRGEEPEAAHVLRGVLDEVPVDDPMVAGELRRFLPYPYVLLPEQRAGFDAADLGPSHRASRALARLVVAVEEGGTPRWEDMPPPPTVLAWLPLRWSVRLAVAAHAAGRAAGLELIGYLLDITGDQARNVLRAAADDEGGGAASTLLAVVPAPPETVTEVGVLGSLVVARDGAPADVAELSRRRVRELMSLLALRGELTREAVMAALWPDLDPARARNNLNVTVRHLRSALEPDRRPGEASFLLRTSGDLLRLHRTPHLRVDLWELRRHLGRARQHEAHGQLAEALGAYAAAAALWRGDPLADLAFIEDLAPEVVAVERDLVEGTCRGAELAVAAHELDRARQLADQVLAHDPLEERAHRALLASALAGGDAGAARAALSRAEEAMTEAGVELAPETLMLARQVDGGPAPTR